MYLYGGEALQPGSTGGASDAEESIHAILNYQPDTAEVDELAAFLLGGSAKPTADDAESKVIRFLLGGDAAPMRISKTADDSTEGTISYLYGGDASETVDEAVMYLYGGEAQQPGSTGGASDAEESIHAILNYQPDTAEVDELAAFPLPCASPRPPMTRLRARLATCTVATRARRWTRQSCTCTVARRSSRALPVVRAMRRRAFARF